MAGDGTNAVVAFCDVFQFTPARGGRQGRVAAIDRVIDVSIHARAWRATVFRSSHPRYIYVSIHARAWRATFILAHCPLLKLFQFTPAPGGRLECSRKAIFSLYVSIHANASLNKASSGYEVWYLSPGYRRTVLDKSAAEGDKTLFPILNSMMEEEYTTESILIAKFIMDGMGAQIGNVSKARGIKAEEWFVVRNANMPSVLIEVGFVTNEKEALNLNNDAYLQKISLGIYNGINAFVTHFERSRGFTSAK